MLVLSFRAERQGVLAFCQWEQLQVEARSSSHENDIVCHSPQNARCFRCRRSLSVVVLLIVNIRRSNGLPGLDSNAAIEARETHPVAKRVCQYTRPYVARPDKDKGGEEAEQGRVGELEHRAEDGHDEGDFGARDAKFVEVVDVGDSKVEWGQEYDLLLGEVGEDVQRHNQGAPDDLFANRSLCGGQHSACFGE
jgi:hypothetical protein